MPEIIQRTYQRYHIQAPIQYGVFNGEEKLRLQESRTLNYSAGGFCYETDQRLRPEEQVCIVMRNYTPGQAGPESYRSYLTRIRWIQPLDRENSDRFAAGARIVARSHEIIDAFSEGPLNNCDLCGALTPCYLLECTENNAQLCEHCRAHFQSLPQGKVRQCLERYLTGNVV